MSALSPILRSDFISAKVIKRYETLEKVANTIYNQDSDDENINEQIMREISRYNVFGELGKNKTRNVSVVKAILEKKLALQEKIQLEKNVNNAKQNLHIQMVKNRIILHSFFLSSQFTSDPGNLNSQHNTPVDDFIGQLGQRCKDQDIFFGESLQSAVRYLYTFEGKEDGLEKDLKSFPAKAIGLMSSLGLKTDQRVVRELEANILASFENHKAFFPLKDRWEKINKKIYGRAIYINSMLKSSVEDELKMDTSSNAILQENFRIQEAKDAKITEAKVIPLHSQQPFQQPQKKLSKQSGIKRAMRYAASFFLVSMASLFGGSANQKVQDANLTTSPVVTTISKDIAKPPLSKKQNVVYQAIKTKIKQNATMVAAEQKIDSTSCNDSINEEFRDTVTNIVAASDTSDVLKGDTTTSLRNISMKDITLKPDTTARPYTSPDSLKSYVKHLEQFNFF